VIERFCDSSDPRAAFTLVATRTIAGETHFIGVGSYVRESDIAAEVAFAVDDAYHGKGIATGLLERLGIEAARRGFRSFRAFALRGNTAMLDVFARCGFQVRSTPDHDQVEVELSLVPTPASVSAAETREHTANVESIRPLLEPRAVAVIGASRDPSRIGRRVLDALTASGYAGPIYPINPHADEIGGRTAFRRVVDIPDKVDLAVIAVPRAAVPAAVDDCAAAGVRALVVLTAGFAEAGDEGRALQDALVAKVRGYGMRMVGPNCMGVVNAGDGRKLNASFSPVFPPAGRLALSSQSGALGIVILALAAERHIGLSTFVSIGNKADVSSNDLLEYWEDDPATRLIALYVESFGNPRRFARLARRIGRKKPIIAVKGGRTRAGSRAAGSHTAALAASDAAVAALFQQTGVIRADTIDEMFDLAACLDTQPLPRGRRVAIVTNAGGPGILAADACETAGLSVVELSETTRREIARGLPVEAQVGNPVDLIASAGPDQYRRAVEGLLTAEETDALLILYTPVDTTHSAAVVAAIRDGVAAGRAAGAVNAANKDKPVLACLMPAPDAPVLEIGTERVPVYPFPENAVRALGKIAAYADWRRAPAGVYWTFDDLDVEGARHLCRAAAGVRGETWLTSEETHRVLEAFRLPVVTGVLTKTAAESVAIASTIGFPVVAKLSSPNAIHKTEVGGVRPNLTTAEAVRTAFAALEKSARERGLTFAGVVIQPMVSGTETMVGVVHDRLFGPLVGFGLGGTEVEVLGDVRFRVAPLSDRDTDELVRETRAFTVLSGHRGRPPGDLGALSELISRASCLAEAVPEILEIDFNPVMVGSAGHGCRIVDARIRVGTLARAKSI
jgi:acetyl coenzyme A synthetase (ADP forming)-like protein